MKIKSLKLKTESGEDIDLSIDEARELFCELSGIFGNPVAHISLPLWYPPEQPITIPFPVITC